MFKGFRRRRASKLHSQAQQLHGEGREDEAIARYQQAVALDPEKSESHYNLGLIYKYRGDWARSFDYNREASTLAPEDEAANWNLGIAATALGDWAVARRAWRQCGVELPEGEGPIQGDLGLTPVRLNPEGDGEVVWARRIDPARARICNVPLPESGFGEGDIVLHDGAAEGFRRLGEREVPVFNVLTLLHPSPNSTFALRVSVASQRAIDTLEALLESAEITCEDWTTQVRILCRACSEGRPHAHPSQEDEAGWQRHRELGVSAPSLEAIEAVIAQWVGSGQGEVEGLECVLPREAAQATHR